MMMMMEFFGCPKTEIDYAFEYLQVFGADLKFTLEYTKRMIIVARDPSCLPMFEEYCKRMPPPNEHERLELIRDISYHETEILVHVDNKNICSWTWFKRSDVKCTLADSDSFEILIKSKRIDFEQKDSHGKRLMEYASEYSNWLFMSELFYLDVDVFDISPNCSEYNLPYIQKKLLENKLPRWSRFDTYDLYPRAFNRIAFKWLLCCKRLKLYKDIRYLILEYIARVWLIENKRAFI